MYELMGDPDLINREVESFRAVDRNIVRDTAIKYLNPENCSTLNYISARTA
jgi:hypothetical protein